MICVDKLVQIKRYLVIIWINSVKSMDEFTEKSMKQTFLIILSTTYPHFVDIFMLSELSTLRCEILYFPVISWISFMRKFGIFA